MTMKLKDVLRYLPQVKSLSKEATTKAKDGKRLTEEARKAREISIALKGVTLYNNFPVKTLDLSGGIEVLSGCDDVKRSAYVMETYGSKFKVTTYRNDGSDVDGTPIEKEYKKAEAVRVAKEYVATGRKGDEAPKSKRGRPKKMTTGVV